jgi:glycosyltransferase involved in cell wall biosynthesis
MGSRVDRADRCNEATALQNTASIGDEHAGEYPGIRSAGVRVTPREACAVPERAIASPRTVSGSLRRVLYVMGLDPGVKFGSMEEQVLQVARAVRERGGQFVPVFDGPLAGRTLQEYAAAGIHAESLSLRRFEPGTLRRLVGLIRSYRVELVHWSFYHPMSPYVWGVSVLQPHVRHLLTDHNSRYSGEPSEPGGARRLLKSFLFPRYESIVCVSDFVQQVLNREGVSRPTQSLRHFINTQRFRPDSRVRASLRDQLRADSSFVLLAVAHLIPEKGIDVLLHALSRLPETAVVWVAGDGPERQNLERLVKELGLDSRVRFLGNQAEIQPYMQAADCLVCPSLWLEAAGLVNIEGLACGLPVLASRIGGIPEIVEHEVSGLLFEPGNVEELAAAAKRIQDSSALRESMSRAARQAAVDHHSIESRIEEYLDLYRAR